MTYTNDIPFPAPERWNAIPEWEGFYEVSDHGRVRSLARVIMRKNGYSKKIPARILKQAPKHGTRRFPATKPYLRVNLCRPGKSKTVNVHKLVLLAFVGPCPVGMEGCHKDDNEANNRLDNLRWDTPGSNVADRYQRAA